jgi:hypothetical protein
VAFDDSKGLSGVRADRQRGRTMLFETNDCGKGAALVANEILRVPARPATGCERVEADLAIL